MNFFKKLWESWKKFGQMIGDFIGRLVLTVFYFTLFFPFGLGVRLWGDPLDIKRSPKARWQDRETKDLVLKDSMRMH